MKPKQEPREYTWCPVCNLRYGFINCRVSKYDKEGKRYEICLTCAVQVEREEERKNRQ